MTLLAIRIGAGVLALLALLTLRGKRWAYFAFVVLGLLYFPAQNHFRVHVPKFDLLIPTMQVLVVLLQNYVYVALFAGVYWMSWVQFRRTDARILWAVLATVLVAALVEIADGMSGRGASRVRDLAPGVAGMLAAALVLALWSRLTRKPGYVRIVKRGRVAAPPPAPPVAPLRGIPTLPVSPRGIVPPPPDFSPTPLEPTEEVAPIRARGPEPEIVQQLVPRLRGIWQRVLAMLQRLWVVIRGRRRAIVIGGVVVILVGAAAFAFVLLVPGPAPTTVAEQPKAPPPPPRPLQSEAQGYYEPDYQFTIADRRFTRLTLRPEAFLTFARYGGKQESGCPDARIGQSAVYLRCEVERVGMMTVDGRFTSRLATSRLDAGVLSALITVTSPRGEVVYRARGSFRWHEPD